MMKKKKVKNSLYLLVDCHKVAGVSQLCALRWFLLLLLLGVTGSVSEL